MFSNPHWSISIPFWSNTQSTILFFLKMIAFYITQDSFLVFFFLPTLYIVFFFRLSIPSYFIISIFLVFLSFILSCSFHFRTHYQSLTFCFILTFKLHSFFLFFSFHSPFLSYLLTFTFHFFSSRTLSFLTDVLVYPFCWFLTCLIIILFYVRHEEKKW